MPATMNPPVKNGAPAAPVEPAAYNPAHAPKSGQPSAPAPKLRAGLEALAAASNGKANEAGPLAPAPSPAAPSPSQEAAAPLEQPTPEGRDATQAPGASPEKPFSLPDDEPGGAPVEKPAAAEPDPAALPEAETFKTNADLRDAYKRAQSELQAARASGTSTSKELAELKAEVTKAKERLQALEPLETEVKGYREKLTATEERLRIADYTQSEEFHRDHVKPLAEASASAERWVGQLKVRTGDESVRQATGDDFKALLRLDYTTAFEAAKTMFGPEFAGRVMDHYEKVQDLLIKRESALQNASTASQNWIKERAEAQQRAFVETKTKLAQAEQNLRTKHKDLYLPPEGDKEAAEIYHMGQRLVDLATEPTPEMTHDEIMSTIAKTRARAAAFPLLALKHARAEKRVAELEAKLKAFEGSEPQPGAGGNAPASREGKAQDLKTRLTQDLKKIAGSRF